MKSKMSPAVFDRRKKFFLVLPVLVLPFVIFLLWILGFVGTPETQAATIGGGLNLTLPSAVPAKDSGWNKMNFYEQADQDSLKWKQERKKDPYYQHASDSILKKSTSHFAYSPYPESAINQTDEEERKANEKIAVIQHELNKKPIAKKQPVMERAVVHSPEVDRLENMMHDMRDRREPDSDLIRMNELMQNIMAVQHPELLQQKIKQQQAASPNKTFVVKGNEPENVTALVETNHFYSLDDNTDRSSSPNKLMAVVADDQTITDGAVLKMRLTQSMYVNGIEVPENHFLYGVAKLTGNRMLVRLSGVQINNEVLPVNLSVYASDGMEGIPVQGVGAKEVLNNSVDQSTQGINISSMGMNVGAEMAGAAVQAGKSLLKKHIKAVTIDVPAGYSVLLKNVQ